MRKVSMIQGGLADVQAVAILGSTTSGITARAGGGQASATALTTSVNVVATCATAGDSVLLPYADAGDEVWVRNNGAASCNVFPRPGGKVNNASADAAMAVANAKTAVFKCIGGVDWIAVLSA